MSAAKHTPGPWNAIPCDNGSAWLVGPREATGQDYVADVHKLTTGRSDEDSEANARLIAAAPGLLEALEISLSDLETLREAQGPLVTMSTHTCVVWIDMLRAAIASARSES